jgi:hypothetical protein
LPACTIVGSRLFIPKTICYTKQVNNANILRLPEPDLSPQA